MNRTIEDAIVNGIKNTIERFQKRPYSYFTESDIHSSLINDIKKDNSDILLYKDEKSQLEVSLVHQEYPTNFRYKKSELLDGYFDEDNKPKEDTLKNTLINSGKGDRGNYDLSILNVDFVARMFNESNNVDKETKNNKVTDLSEAIKYILNKDIRYPMKRCTSLEEHPSNAKYYASDLENDLLIAVEVKFIHPFNARSKDMLYEVIKDNAKLNLAKIHTNTKTINIVFCSSEEQKRRVKDSDVNNKPPVISKIRDYIQKGKVTDYDGTKFKMPEGVINIFIESYLSDDKIKSPKPVVNMIGNTISNDLLNKLKNEI